MHVCEGTNEPTTPSGGPPKDWGFCQRHPKKYLITEMLGTVPISPPFSMDLCDHHLAEQHMLYSSPGYDAWGQPNYWWNIQPCGVIPYAK